MGSMNSEISNAKHKSYLNSIAEKQDLPEHEDEPMNNPKSLGSDNNLYMMKFYKKDSDKDMISNERPVNKGYDISSGEVSNISYDPSFEIA